MWKGRCGGGLVGILLKCAAGGVEMVLRDFGCDSPAFLACAEKVTTSTHLQVSHGLLRKSMEPAIPSADRSSGIFPRQGSSFDKPGAELNCRCISTQSTTTACRSTFLSAGEQFGIHDPSKQDQVCCGSPYLQRRRALLALGNRTRP